MLDMIFPYRYLIGLMGFFSTYCGFIYNDFLSMSLNLFSSCYVTENVQEGTIIDRISSDCTYPIGLDPIWSVA
jgi:V-type H+-transporting ATPase subunit a